MLDNRKSNLYYWIREGWWLLLFALVFGLISALYPSNQLPIEGAPAPNHIPQWPRILIAEIAIAFIVSFILIVTAERKHQARTDDDFSDRQKVLSKNIFDYIYGVKVPSDLFKFVEDKIIGAKFFRENVKIDYTFRETPAGDQYTVFSKFSYSVRNLTDNQQKYILKGTIEKPHKDNGRAGGQEPLGLKSLYVDGALLTEEDMEAAKNAAEDTEDYFAVEHPIMIPANDVRKIKGTYLMRKGLSDYELWRCIEPCSGLSVTINAPDDVDMKLRPIHPNRNFDHDDRETMQNGPLCAEIHAPLLPQNGILIWWDKKDASPAPTTPAATDVVPATPEATGEQGEGGDDQQRQVTATRAEKSSKKDKK